MMCRLNIALQKCHPHCNPDREQYTWLLTSLVDSGTDAIIVVGALARPLEAQPDRCAWTGLGALVRVHFVNPR